MSLRHLFAPACIAAVGLAAGCAAVSDPSGDRKPAAQPEMKLPPGFTEADMKACMLAGTPGKMHEHLAKCVGMWHGKTSMWPAPGTEPAKSECTSEVTLMLDGRFTKCEVKGEMPGMGPYHGFGLYGFDNVTQKFQSTWLDNHGTGMMTGTGKLSADGKVMTWNYSAVCPVTKKPMVLREVETVTGPNTKTLEMFGTGIKGDKEYRMMLIEFTKK